MKKIFLLICLLLVFLSLGAGETHNKNAEKKMSRTRAAKLREQEGLELLEEAEEESEEGGEESSDVDEEESEDNNEEVEEREIEEHPFFAKKDEEEEQEQEDEYEGEVEVESGPFVCSVYIGPSTWIEGIGIIAGTDFAPEQGIDFGIGIPVPNRIDEHWQLDNYAFASNDPDHSLAVIGITMLFNHREPSNTGYFYDAKDHVEVNDSLDHPFTTHHPIYHLAANHTTIKAGEEIFSKYGEGAGWFADRNITLISDEELQKRLRVVSQEELQRTSHCLSQVVIGDSDLPFAGKGIFAARSFQENEIVTVTPALVLPRFSVGELGEKSLLQNYCIAEVMSEICLLPIGPAGVANHAQHPNVFMEWYTWPQSDPESTANILKSNSSELLNAPFTKLYLGYRAVRNISAGEEITINYGPLWLNDWTQYLSHLVHFLELKLHVNGKEGEETTDQNIPLPLFRSFIGPPAGLFPKEWNIDQELYNEYMASVEARGGFDIEEWEKAAAEVAAHAANGGEEEEEWVEGEEDPSEGEL